MVFEVFFLWYTFGIRLSGKPGSLGLHQSPIDPIDPRSIRAGSVPRKFASCKLLWHLLCTHRRWVVLDKNMFQYVSNDLEIWSSWQYSTVLRDLRGKPCLLRRWLCALLCPLWLHPALNKFLVQSNQHCRLHCRQHWLATPGVWTKRNRSARFPVLQSVPDKYVCSLFQTTKMTKK